MLGPGLSNLQRVYILEIHGNLLNTFSASISDVGPRVLEKVPMERVIYLKCSEMLSLYLNLLSLEMVMLHIKYFLLSVISYNGDTEDSIMPIFK